MPIALLIGGLSIGCSGTASTTGASSSRGIRASESPVDQLYRLVSAERQRLRLPKLALDAKLSAIAAEYAQVSSGLANASAGGPRTANNGVPVNSADDTETLGIAQRLATSGIRSGLVFESLASGSDAAAICDTLLRRPRDRAHLLNREITHLGIAMTPQADGDRRGFRATLISVRMIDDIDVARAPADLLVLINRNRNARGTAALEPERNLSAAAQAAAQGYLADPQHTQQDAVDEASAQLRHFSIAFRRIGGVMAVVPTLADAAALEPLFESDLRYVGIGIVQGSRIDIPTNSIVVLIMFAWPR